VCVAQDSEWSGKRVGEGIGDALTSMGTLGLLLAIPAALVWVVKRLSRRQRS
jgi:hypothetical protein